ncbi:MAG TPA: hypothetical protein VLQ93_01270 [Myxococcaceae bacterium]|nr:hypothetical protein [Myxococcaceae bacterium]
MLELIIVGLLCGVLGGVLLLYRRARRARLRGTPRTPVREARPGAHVKVAGRVRAEKPLRAPLSGKDCVFYQLTILEQMELERRGNRSGGGSDMPESTWVELSRETEYAPGWVLEDESGELPIEPASSHVESALVREYRPGSLFNGFEVAPEVLSRYLSTRQRQEERIQMKERRIDQGARLVALGQVALGPEGRVLAGGEKLTLFEGDEKELLSVQSWDVIAWGLVLTGVLLLAGGLVAGWEGEEEPFVAPEAEPIPLRLRQGAPGGQANPARP